MFLLTAAKNKQLGFDISATQLFHIGICFKLI